MKLIGERDTVGILQVFVSNLIVSDLMPFFPPQMMFYFSFLSLQSCFIVSGKFLEVYKNKHTMQTIAIVHLEFSYILVFYVILTL